MEIKINESKMVQTLKNERFFDTAIQYLDTLKVMGVLKKNIPKPQEGFSWKSCYFSHDKKLKIFAFPELKTIQIDTFDDVVKIQFTFKSQFGF
jgi:hypothetical protein